MAHGMTTTSTMPNAETRATWIHRATEAVNAALAVASFGSALVLQDKLAEDDDANAVAHLLNMQSELTGAREVLRTLGDLPGVADRAQACREAESEAFAAFTAWMNATA